MQNFTRIAVAALIVLAIAAFMVTYSVRFTESAVVTTFGKASENSVKLEPGLGFKWPYPIQSVTKYDTRPRYVETKPETFSTKDNRQLVMQGFLTWKVVKPLEFYQLYSSAGARPEDHYRKAEETIRAQLRSAMAETSTFEVGELLNTGAAGSKFPELEQKIFDRLKSDAKSAFAASGVELVKVGIHSVELPQATTKQVFDRMKMTRERLAASALSEGTARAESIRAQASSDAKKILDFAERRAGVIRAQGDQEAAKFLQQMASAPELAVFLQNLEFLRRTTSKNTTIVMPMSQAGLGLIGPNAAEQIKSGKIPAINTDATPKGDTK